ncbi:MAG: hypothetical protein RBR51_02125 [Candidatus Cloacimonadaceae bacterium]|nr:hypothetical protein [Candidatus Cloacimonadaceae bacterium]
MKAFKKVKPKPGSDAKINHQSELQGGEGNIVPSELRISFGWKY